MNKKQVASWIVTTVLIAGTGAALAEGGDAGSDPTITDTTVTTVVDDTTTTVAVDDTTTTTVDESTTTTTVADPEADADVAADGETDGGGNSAAAQNHDCDEAWGNHGAWVSANAHAMKTGDEVSCDGPTTVDESSATTDTTAAPTSDTSSAGETETTTSSHGRGHGKSGHGSHGKNK
jgi:hypothetical protein